QGLDVANWLKPPYRAPHHTASAAALVGGGCQFQQLTLHSNNSCYKIKKVSCVSSFISERLRA
ncbi:MAG: ATP-binding protein, partial [Pseudobdellovibrionaceae bacterium]